MHILFLSAAKDLANIIVRNKKDDMKKSQKVTASPSDTHIHRFKRKSIITESQMSASNVYKQNLFQKPIFISRFLRLSIPRLVYSIYNI